MEIKDRIKQLRSGAKVSQAEFAEMIECTKSQVAQWEVGNNYPKLENLIRIARVFDVTTDWLLMGIPERNEFGISKRMNVRVADLWKDNHINYLKERIRDLELKESTANQLKENIQGLQEFVLEQFSKIGNRDYQELRTALSAKIVD